MTITSADIIAKGLGEHLGQHGPTARRAKYGNRAVTMDGLRFDSQKELTYFQGLSIRKQAGDLRWFLRRPRFDLPGQTIYESDFLVVDNDGRARIIDCKSPQTRKLSTYRMKVRQMKAIWGIDVEEV